MDVSLLRRTTKRPARLLLRSAIVLLVLGGTLLLESPRPGPVHALTLNSQLTQLENFDTLTFTPDAMTAQVLVAPPLEGTNSTAVTYTAGNTYAYLTRVYSPARDFSGAFLHLDIYTDSSTTNLPAPPSVSMPTIRLASNGRIALQAAVPIRAGEWNGVNIDLATANQSLLAAVDTISLYVSDSNNPGQVTYKLDDLYVSKVALPATAPTSTLIILGWHPEEVNNYKLLNGAKTHFAFRTRAFSINDSVITSWDASHTPYYFTTASSDYVSYDGKPLYESQADVKAVASRSAAEGLYMHEVVSYLAASNAWNWATAVNQFDWKWMNQIVMYAKSYGKKVVWSEPAEAWKFISTNSSAMTWLARWGSTIVPTFATNFQSPASGYHMTSARDYGALVAGKSGMYFGESHQSFYFSEQNIPITRQSSAALARLGYDQRASYYEFEAAGDGLLWSSAYMQGVSDFAAWLNSH